MYSLANRAISLESEGLGVFLFLESNLMVRVIQRCMSRNLPVVSVYDSIIMPKKHEKEAKEIIRTSDLRGTRTLLLNDEQGILNPKTAR